MDKFLKYLEPQELRRLESGVDVTLDDQSNGVLSVILNPTQMNVSVTARDRAAKLIVVRDCTDSSGAMRIDVAKGAKLDLLEVIYDGAEGEVVISQGGDSLLQATLLQVEASKMQYVVNLEGAGGDASVDMIQMVTGDDVSSMNLRLAHQSADCTSHSLSKCVASERATGEFNGLVYVAQDAQRTYAEQSSRNIMLSNEARIIAQPQLEIYADDVKCSHGATVGEINHEAIYYMMQRGLSEDQARKLQLDGFVSEVTQRCAIEQLREALSELVRERLHQL